MTTKKTGDSEIMSWDPENMDKYWRQCRHYDTSPLITIRQSQLASQNAFSSKLTRLGELRRIKKVY